MVNKSALDDEHKATVGDATDDIDEVHSEEQKKWYAVHAYAGCENVVKVALQERIVRDNLQDKFGDILIPTEEVVELRGGVKKKSTRKFFPGYVLVNMVLDEDTWHLVRSVPKVLGFIGGKSDKPAAITPAEVDTIMSRINVSSDKPRPKVIFEVGEVLRVVDGPFADFNGVVEEVNYEKNRLRVSVLIFGRATPVELQFDQVEKA